MISAYSIDRISISVSGTGSSINTVIYINCLIDEGVVRASGDTFMFNIGECIVGVVVSRAGGDA